MQGTYDVDQTGRADDGDGLDPREAARLFAQTEREARRQFNLSPQWINAVTGAVILVAYGSLWLSTRGQHPYKGPSLGVVALVYVAVAVAFAVSVKVYRRATAGVSGPAVRQQQVEGVAILVSFVLGRPVASPSATARMTRDSLDPVIHAPARLRILATLAALPDGASLSFTRLQDMLELTPGNLITHLRKLEDAGYLNSETTGNGRAS